MDFQKLLQQAKAKQTVVEKKHVKQKSQKEVEKRQKELIQLQNQKEANEKLKKLKEAAVKKKLEYKGLHRPSLASSRASTKPSSSSQSSVSKSSKSPSSKSSSKSTSSKSTSKSPSSKSSSKSSSTKSPSTGASKAKLSNGSERGGCASSSKTSKLTQSSSKHGQKSGGSQRPSQKSVPASSKSSKSTTSKAPVVNFNDLMKMAKMNKEMVKESPVASVNNHKKGDAPSRQSSSPVGKLLLDKASSRLKGKRTHEEMVRPSSLTKNSSKIDLTSSPNKAHQTPSSPIKSVTVDVFRHPCTKSPSKLRGNTERPKPRNGQSVPVRNSKSQSSVSVRSSLPQTSKSPLKHSRTQERPKPGSQPQNRRAETSRQKARPTHPTSFYGSAAARILGQKDGRPSFGGSSRGAPLSYTSTWVDEMKDLVAGEEYEGYSDEDEDDLDGFVVDSDDDFIDDGDGGDYSSHIRQIFGYDRRRFADERVDDRLMESSFAQQEFEEARSARIGKLEDDEDVRREQEELSQKKRKLNPNRTTYGGGSKSKKSGLKQSKLSF